MFSTVQRASNVRDKKNFLQDAVPFSSLFLIFSFSLFFHLSLHLPPEVYRERERVHGTDGTLYERNRRITFVVRIFISKNYGPFEGFSTIHFGVSGNPSLFDFVCESTECRASFMPSRVHLRVTTDSVRPCAIPEGKRCFLVSGKERYVGWPSYSFLRKKYASSPPSTMNLTDGPRLIFDERNRSHI